MKATQESRCKMQTEEEKNNSISFEAHKYQLDNNFKNRLQGQSVRLYRCFRSKLY